jgi:hypothetical protein
MSVDPQYSVPLITFFDKTIFPNANVSFGVPRPTLGGIDIIPFVQRNTNRVETGQTQTIAFHQRDEIAYRSDFVDGTTAALLRRLFKSTLAKETFSFKLHYAMTTPYEDNSKIIWDNFWTVIWKDGYDRLMLGSAGPKGLYTVQLEMESIAVEVN